MGRPSASFHTHACTHRLTPALHSSPAAVLPLYIQPRACVHTTHTTLYPVPPSLPTTVRKPPSASHRSPARDGPSVHVRGAR
ncbi:hypothetical protein HYPSUDRAFT_46216 [Hypholoma sublateritium FD-334 SS-4]|uniref:Uncharacterized protein n=1 Tax=Hypholoma sublateritium (strain FD-334 SS-4) TaxID=945553 RepID=A0A0D2NLP3_HYPSF|nr:hypothetical protein HYPSUDRAFT_46216 [Hypholoma sublateritium FD-334 SS-4]